MLAPALVMLVLLAAVTVYAIFYYGNRRKITAVVFIITFVGWYFPFSIVFLVPLDVLSTNFNNCNATVSVCEEPIAYVNTTFLEYIWQINYWTSFLLTWLLAPFLQTYVLSGGFTFWQRCWDSLKENLILYAILAVVGIGVLIYIGVAYQMDMNALLDFVKLLANAYGLLLVVVFMSYGMIDIPRRLWSKGNLKFQTRYVHFKVPSYREDYEEAEANLRDLYREINWAQRKVDVRSKHRKWLDIIIAKCPPEYADAGAEAPEEVTEVSDKQLRKLHASLMDKLHIRDRCRTAVSAYAVDSQWTRLMKRAFLLQDIETNRSSRDQYGIHGPVAASGPGIGLTGLSGPWYPCPRPGRSAVGNSIFVQTWKPANLKGTARFQARLAWYWHCIFEPWVFRFAALLAGAMSLMLLWSECTFSVEQPKLSIFYLVLGVAGDRTFGVMLVTLTILFYMCACSYTPLMRLRIFNYFYLVGGHHTDSNSLLFLGAMLCRLTFPLCYNFTFLVDITGTVFQSQMGDVAFMPLLGVGFNVYFPIILSILCLLVVFNVYERILARFHVRVFRYSDITDEVSQEGQQLIDRARAQVEREPGNEAAFDVVAGTYRGGRSGGRPRASREALAPTSNSTSPTMSPMELEEPPSKSVTPAAKVKSMFSSLFGGRSGRNGTSASRDLEGHESRAPLRTPGSMNGARGAAEDSDDVEDRLADLDADSLNMISSSRPAATSRYSGTGRARRDFFSDI